MKKSGKRLLLFLLLGFCLAGCGENPAAEDDRGELVQAGETFPGFLFAVIFR